ncbi:MAG: glycosyl hydrolase [Chitinophagaceae bacterium]|nr:glycosyl hydrolase [Chitinophagaceae bacterium]
MKNLFKFTIILLLVIVNSVQAQVKPSTAAERSNGLQKRKLLEKDTTLYSIKFRNVGPSVMSGRVVDVDVNPADPTEFYVAYATGGLWYTKNNGQSLVPVFDKENAFGIGDIAVNWSDGIIWIGTGEANSSRSSYSGLGVYKSVDKGKTWEQSGLPESHHIGKINLHPTDNNIAWVAVLGHLYSSNKERGIYKTTDGGKTWKQTLYVDENTGAVDMDINPKNPDELYAAMWYRTRRAWNFEEGGKTTGIYKSIDGGNTWKHVSAAGSGFPAGDGLGRIGVAVFAANPNIIYATLDNQGRRPDTAQKKTDTNYVLKNFKDLTKESFAALDDKKLDSFLFKNNFKEKYTAATVKELVKTDKIKPTEIYNYLFDANTALFETPIIGCEVYRSDDAGISWRKVNTKGLNTYNTYGYYFGKISVSNTNADKIVISGYDLLLSTDGGKTFKSTDNDATHADWHGCWMNPNKDSHWIAGNDGGCNVTYDNGEHWFKANTPSVGQFYKITVDDAKPYNIYGGLQDNGTWYGPSTAKDISQWDYEGVYPWKQIGGGDGMQVQVDTRDNKTAYTGSQFGFYGRRSTEGGPQGPAGRRLFIYPRPDIGEPKYRFNWQTPIWLSKHNQDIFYYGTNRFHRSLLKGENLETLSNDLTNGSVEGDVPFGTATTLVESPMKFGLLYVGTDDGNIHVSKDAGYNWTKINTNLPKMLQGLYVSRVTPSAFKEGRVYVSLNGYRRDHFGAYLLVSEDFGNTWTQLGNDLPMEPINVVTEDPKKEYIIYVGTDNGLYASFNMGKSFLTLDNNLPLASVHDIAVQQRENELVIGTHGRSIYITKLKEIQKLYDKMMEKK